MKNLIYVRVSTDDQNNDLQVDVCKKYCDDRSLPYEIIEDKISGAKTSRLGFDLAMKKVREGSVERIICYKLDRLGRSLSHLAMLIEEFKSRGVAFVAVSQGIDTSASSPVGNLQLHVLMAIAEFERTLIKERVIAGIAAAKKKGIHCGRKSTHAVTVQLVKDMRLRGMSLGEISKATGVNKGTLSRMARTL